MSRRHFYLAAILVVSMLVGVAPAPWPIDDFESYMDDTELQGVWRDESTPPSWARATLITSGAPQGYQAMDMDYHVAGGWLDPQNPTDYSGNDHAGLGRTFDALDFVPGAEIRMTIQAEGSTNPGRPSPDWDIAKLNYFLIEWTGDKWGQTWIPGQAQLNPWWAPHPYPAVIVSDNWVNPGNIAGIGPGTKIIRPSSGWVEIEITDEMWVAWGASLESFDAMTGIHLQLWSGWTDTTGTIWPLKIRGTETVWPPGPLDGSIDVDYIQYIPEPATVALVGLGGLALLRRKR